MKQSKSANSAQHPAKRQNRLRSSLQPAVLVFAGILIGAVAASLFWGFTETFDQEPAAALSPETQSTRPRALESTTATPTTGLWDGPIVYRRPGSPPLHLILVEKAAQTLRLYRFDGSYTLIKTYPCATGEKKGKKSEARDEKTPEGIYFNTKSYRDRKVTIFGDRAFELNYPNPYDVIEGNGGHGIYIHGSNRSVTPFSTNGCVALDNEHLADLDGRTDLKETPVIMGETLPYRFNPPGTEMTALLPALQQAMRPAEMAKTDTTIDDLTVLSHADTRLAIGRVRSTGSGPSGLSRLYMTRPVPEMTLLIRREWLAEGKTPPVTVAAAAPPSEAVDQVRRIVASWRQAWANKAIDAYIDHYHSDFQNDGKNRLEWKAYKDRLNRKYKRISVTVDNLRISVDGETASAYFRQRYQSDTFKSEGYKRLLLKRQQNGWKILRETSYARKPAGWPA